MCRPQRSQDAALDARLAPFAPPSAFVGFRCIPRRHPRAGGQKGGPAAGHNGLIPLSSNEIRRLLAALVLAPIACVTTTITWSNWRRRRQHQALDLLRRSANRSDLVGQLLLTTWTLARSSLEGANHHTAGNLLADDGATQVVGGGAGRKP